jgi:hypothetical protein
MSLSTTALIIPPGYWHSGVQARENGAPFIRNLTAKSVIDP